MAEIEVIGAQALSDLIGAIYDCALDPQQWLATCTTIVELCGSTAGGLCVHDLRHAQNDQWLVIGYGPDLLAELTGRHADCPMAQYDVTLKVGEVAALSMERFHLHDSRFFHEVMAPFDVADIAWFPALRTAGHMASMHVSRGALAGSYGQRQLERLSMLAPHVCRSLAVSNAIDLRALRSEALEQTLNDLGAGVFLVTRDGRVVFMNSAAQAQVRNARSIRLMGDRVSPRDAFAAATLSRAIAQIGREHEPTPAIHQYIAMPDGVGGGCVATLLPIESGHRHGMLAPFAASVAIFVQDPVSAPLMPGNAFARLHGLTSGELRVLEALSQGLGGTEAASMLGITEPTIRTHLQHLYAKTGTARQSDLLRLFHDSTPPTRSDAQPGAH